VAAGIFTSRFSGFLRDVVIAAFFGAGPVMSAYVAALKIPNILRNLLGEGTLSASFVPVYSSALGRGDVEDARRSARGVLGLVLLIAGLVVALGIATAPWLVRIVAPGFEAEVDRLTVRLIRILFPMAGLMMIGAWCLGILTSHRRFFLPFAAPVLWNLAQIVGLLLGARLGWGPLIVVLAWSTLAGAVLQVLVQLPAVIRLVGDVRPALDRSSDSVRTVTRNAAPVVAGQGIFQISSLIDVTLASTLFAAGGAGAIGAMYFAQRIVQLPMALFGASVAVAALPEMSREGAIGELQPHLAAGLRRILYFVVPAAVVLLLYGDLVTSLIYQRGAFDAADVRLVRWILGAYASGLIATSLVKLFASAYYALEETRTPVKYAAVAVAMGVTLGAGLMFWLSGRGWGARAVAGLALGGAAGAWLNLGLLARGLARRGLTGVWRPAFGSICRIALGGAVAAGLSWPVRFWIEGTLGAGTLARAGELGAVVLAGAIPYVFVAGLGPLRRREGREQASTG